ncbi:MAG: LysM domain-containing protein [Myxococcales bacterium]|nr:LysM domain-containing protein [Myxococcales bacterium]
MSLPGGNASKASFLNLDTNEPAFEVQYNPKEFRVEKSVTWQEASNQGQSNNPIQFQKGAPMTASFDLTFDTTADGANVQKVWVDKLLSLTNANQTPKQGEPAEQKKKRPPALHFKWGTFELKCVVESISTTYLMFASDGTAVRARCGVKLKQWELGEFAGSGTSDRFNADRITLVVVKGGETASQVAAANGVDLRALAKANKITDPMADLTGKTLTVVKNAAESAANAVLDAALSGRPSKAGKAAATAAKSSVTGAASTAAKNALKKLF